MNMINKMLHAKHWQIFLIYYGIPILLQMILMGTMFSSVAADGEPNLENFFDIFKVIPFIVLISFGTFILWLWSVGTGLNDKISTELRPKTGLYKICLSFQFIYVISIMIIMMNFMSGQFSDIIMEGAQPDLESYSIFAWIIPLHLLCMLGFIYVFYFAAKTIKTAELQRKVSFGDFAGEFFLIWFFFIGVWILQPRINKLIKDQGSLAEQSLIDA